MGGGEWEVQRERERARERQLIRLEKAKQECMLLSEGSDRAERGERGVTK